MAVPLLVKRLSLTAFDGLFALACAVALTIGFPVRAFAYIDPSVMTYTVQALAGVAVGLSAVFGVAWRRGRRALMRLLDIDPDAKLIHEPDVKRAPSDSLGGQIEGEAEEAAGLASPDLSAPPASSSQAEQAGKRGFLDRRPYAPGWKARLGLACIVGGFLLFTVFFAAPLEIVKGSAHSLVYAVEDVWWVLALADIALLCVGAFVASALRKGPFIVTVAFVFAVGACAYVQALVMNEGLPAADGASIHWGDYMAQQVVTAAIWVVLIAGFIAYALHNRRRAQGIMVLGSVLLTAVQAIALAATLASPGAALQADAAPGEGERLPPLAVAGEAPKADAKAVMTEDGLFTVSPEQNVIVFVLDTFDDAYLRRIMAQDSHLLDEFSGFTDYENCTGSLIPTRFAVPQMLTGQMPSFDEPFGVYLNERYRRSAFLPSIANAGWSIGLYTDSLTVSHLPAEEQAHLFSLTENIHGLPGSAMDFWPTLGSLCQMALYRDAPWALKWAFWYYTDQMNTAYAAYEEGAPADETIYVLDDVRYYDRLRSFGLSVEDEGSGAFRFIHLLGSHYPFSYDEQANDVGDDNSDVFKQSRGVLHIVSEYLRRLKDLGLYAGATIIVTADHGYWTITEEPIEEASNPIMFVKPSQTQEEAQAPLRFDTKPVSQLDLQATILDAMGLDYSSYAESVDFPGYSMFDEVDESRVRHYLTTDSEPDRTETQLREYVIEGNALDFDNWIETGRTIDARRP